MKAAFEVLGYPTWHWVTMSENPPDMLAMWTSGLEAKYRPSPETKPFTKTEFVNLLGRWSACTDQPAALFAPELISAYPSAKVVLVERDPDRWYESFKNTVIAGSSNAFIPFISLLDSVYIGPMCRMTDLMAQYYFHVRGERTWWGVLNSSEYFAQWRKNAKEVYLEHNEMIKRVTPKERLLVFRLEEGWEPLCEFLGKPVPDVPFPRVNETKVAQEMVNVYIWESYKRWTIRALKQAVPILMIVGVVWVFWRGK